MTEIEHQGTVAMADTPSPQITRVELFRLIAQHYMSALEKIVIEDDLEACHRLACEALGTMPTPKTVPTNDIVERLRRYRPRDEFGDPVKHTICNEAADEIERLRPPAPANHVELDRARVSGFAEGIERAAKIADEHASDFERQADGKDDPHAHDALLLAADACELTADAIRSIMGGSADE